MPKITVNGEPKDVEGALMLGDLLARLKQNAAYLAVAVNERVVPRSERNTTKIKDGDRIEIIHAVGGG